MKGKMVIYKAWNKINKKIYVGQTVQKLEHRILEHLRHKKLNNAFPFALRKYGRENFIFETMAICDTKDKADFLEEFYIKYFNSFTPNGYNLTLGGGGNSGHVSSLETNEKISQSLMGRKIGPFSKEHKRKIGEALKGKLRSEKHKINLSRALTGLLVGNKNPNFGNHWTDEMKSSMSEKKKNPTEEYRVKLRAGQARRRSKKNADLY